MSLLRKGHARLTMGLRPLPLLALGALASACGASQSGARAESPEPPLIFVAGSVAEENGLAGEILEVPFARGLSGWQARLQFMNEALARGFGLMSDLEFHVDVRDDGKAFDCVVELAVKPASTPTDQAPPDAVTKPLWRRHQVVVKTEETGKRCTQAGAGQERECSGGYRERKRLSHPYWIENSRFQPFFFGKTVPGNDRWRIHQSAARCVVVETPLASHYVRGKVYRMPAQPSSNAPAAD